MGFPTILILDDDPAESYSLSNSVWASYPHAEIQWAHTREEFEDRIGRHHFDCVIMNDALQGQSTDDEVSLLKAKSPLSAAILISADSARNIVFEGLRSGCVDFVSKHEAGTQMALAASLDRSLHFHDAGGQDRRRLQRRIESLRRMAETDPLTGLCNRRGIEAMFEHDPRRNVLDRRGSTCLVMIDVDHFKDVNDTYGHPCGDVVLNQVGRLISELTQGDYRVCRWGGDEFLMVLPATGLAEGVAWVERMRQSVAAHRFHTGLCDISVTVSAGIAEISSASITHAAINQADQALYFAKRAGRNRLCVWGMAAFEDKLRSVRGEGVTERLAGFLHAKQDTFGDGRLTRLARHSHEVSRRALGLGRRIGMAPVALERLRTVGLCHDLGMLLVPEHVLAKRGPLSDTETQLVNRHSEDGALMTQMLGGDEETADWVRWHHLPFGSCTSAAQTPVGPRIISVAAALVAMTSDRPYRAARSMADATAEIRRLGGRQFDPLVAEALQSVSQPCFI